MVAAMKFSGCREIIKRQAIGPLLHGAGKHADLHAVATPTPLLPSFLHLTNGCKCQPRTEDDDGEETALREIDILGR